MLCKPNFLRDTVAAAALAAFLLPGAIAQVSAPAAPATQSNMQTMPARGGATGAGNAASTNANAPRADRSFVKKAAQGGMAEVQLGQLAQQKASHEQVKQFGARMVQDHSKANDELRQIAAGKGMELPGEPSKKQRKDADKLKDKSGAEFDRSYMKHMVADHKKDIEAYEKEAREGKDAELRAFAERTLPTLREHLQMAQQANDAVQRNKKSK